MSSYFDVAKKILSFRGQLPGEIPLRAGGPGRDQSGGLSTALGDGGAKCHSQDRLEGPDLMWF